MLVRAVSVAVFLFIIVPLAGRAQRGPAFSTEDLRGWLTYLASDDLQGRQVFTEGIGLAAAYIADQLKAFGVEPAGDEGTYFQTVKVLGMRTRSQSSVTVTVKGQSRTFADGEGVTFARNQGAKQVVSAPVEFVGYGFSYSPLNHDDYRGRDVRGRVVLYIGRLGPGMTNEHNRLINARARLATETMQAAAAIGPVAPPTGGRGGGAPTPGASNATPPPGRGGRGAAPAPDFQTAQGVDAPVPPQLTAGDEFFEFVFSASGHSYTDLKAKAEAREPLPRIDLGDVRMTIRIDAEYDVAQTRLSRNVVGLLRGSDPGLSAEYVLLGAHYDHSGYRQTPGPAGGANTVEGCPGQTRPTPPPGDIINNGADDNASGTTALLAIAKAVATAPRPKRSILFVWHTGEESGLWGSRYMAANPVVPLERMAAHLNIDMVGRNNCDDPAEANTVYLVGSDRISTELHNINEEANAALPAPLTLDYSLNDPADLESIYTRSDHYSYAAKGIPVIFFTTGGHRDYHFVTDEVERIEFDKLARVTALVHATAMRVANHERMPVRDNKGPRRGRGQTGPIR